MNPSLLRKVILAMLFITTGLSFLDRQVLSVAILKMQQEFTITDIQYGFVNTAFLVSYAIMFSVSGRLIDKMGSTLGLAISVGIWSLANILHGTVTTVYQLIAFRFLLGAGEGGCFPGAAKVVAEWFDERRRALANGIAIGGSAIGAVIAPPLTIWMTAAMGWQAGFVLPGLVGLIWVGGWLLLLRRRQGSAVRQSSASSPLPSLGTLLQNRRVWIFILIRFLLDPVLYFIMFWAPKYLSSQRGASFEAVGKLFWIPFLALGISNIFGGWLSDRLIRSGMTTGRARKTIMGAAAALTMAAPFIAVVSTVEAAVILMAVILFAHGCWITNYITAITDTFGSNATSTVVGLSGTAGAVSSLLINPLMGVIIQNSGYRPLWIGCGCMYPLGFLLLAFFIRNTRQRATVPAV
ncbi:MFS transporter [Compostibacter hankyongensis]|uniref:MFS transporter n=1 Tax=Compostibacter hankyongensis TaxID=1007089 RepID=A0ABP8G413_9BACT